MSLKSCFKCNVEKPLSEFYVHSRMADGHLNKCKACTKADVKARAIANPEKIAAYEKVRSAAPERKAKTAAIVRKWGEDFPERRAAASKVARAVRAGKIIKTPCHICGSEKSVGHHADYSRPLDVVWLCQRHHKQAHALA